MQQVVDNQIHMDPKAEARMAQGAAGAARDGHEDLPVHHRGRVHRESRVCDVVAAVVSLVLWGTINFVFGGKATFGSVFAVWLYASLPSIIKSLLGTVVIFAGMAPESFNIKNFAPTNLGAFLDPVETNKALYALATSLDAITIWTLVLLGMGLATVAGVKRGSGYIACLAGGRSSCCSAWRSRQSEAEEWRSRRFAALAC